MKIEEKKWQKFTIEAAAGHLGPADETFICPTNCDTRNEIKITYISAAYKKKKHLMDI